MNTFSHGSLEGGFNFNCRLNDDEFRSKSLLSGVLSRRPFEAHSRDGCYKQIASIEPQCTSRSNLRVIAGVTVQLNSISIRGKKKTRRSWEWSKSNATKAKDVETTIGSGLSSLTQPKSSTRLWTTHLLGWGSIELHFDESFNLDTPRESR